jgi:hypothetical protein
MWILPALGILLVYGWFFSRLPIRRLKALDAQVRAATDRTPRPSDVEAERARGVMLERELEKVQSALARVREELSGRMSSWTNQADRLTGNDRLSGLWTRHGLRLREQVPVNDESALSPALQQLVDRARSDLGVGRHPVLWEVRLMGGYLSMLHALEELARSEVAAVVVSLQMSDEPGQTGKAWKLQIWQ